MPVSISKYLLAAALALASASAQRCDTCHAEIVKRYLQTPMAQSVGGRPPAADADFLHAQSSSTMRAGNGNGRMTHSVTRDGITASYPVALAIGSGRVGQSYAVRIHGDLFQSPISWYKQAMRWGISPGFEQERHPDFDRPITNSCLFCHSTPSQSGPAAIGCERCHGDGSRHAASPSKANIIQPARLPTARRDAVCEQCHLQGVARVLQPNKRESDYVPGMALEEVFSTFVQLDADFRVVSHSEQLSQSACARSSEGRLWCGSCHDPHPSKATANASHQQRCESCHPGVKAKHQGPAEDCVGCHMPRRPVSDVAHTTYTDHRIARRANASSLPAISLQLKAWRPAENDDRALALAYAALGNLEAANSLMAKLLPQRTRDAELLVSAGSVALGLKRPVQALRHFTAARMLEPRLADHYFRVGLAHEANQEIQKAMGDYRQALIRNPAHFDSTARLASIERKNGDLDAYRKTLEAFLKISPQNISVRKLLADK